MCNLVASTIPPLPNDNAIRSKLSWAEILQCAPEKYDECLNNAFRDAHFPESPTMVRNTQNDNSFPEYDERSADLPQNPDGNDDEYNKFRLLPEEPLAREMARAEKALTPEDFVFVEDSRAENGGTDSIEVVQDLLKYLRLDGYATTFEEQGYDNMDSIKGMTHDELVEMMRSVGMMERPGHCHRLNKWHIEQNTQPPTHVDGEAFPGAPVEAYPGYHQFGQSEWTMPSLNDDWMMPHVNDSMMPPGLYPPNDEWMMSPVLYPPNDQQTMPVSYQCWPPVIATYTPNDQGWTSIVRMAKDATGTRRVQGMLTLPWNDHVAHIMEEVTQNLPELMFNPHGIFTVKACFKLVLEPGTPDPALFRNSAFKEVMQHWDHLVAGRQSAFAYKMVMWMIEVLYAQNCQDQLQEVCQKALDSSQQLVTSNYGHLVLQHAVHFTHKALVENASGNQQMWIQLRCAFFDAAVRAWKARDGWDKKTNPASHFINKCLELLASNTKRRDEALNGHRAQVMQAVAEDPGLLNLVALHLSGQFTARRIYELGTSQERRWMEREAPSIHRP